MLVPLFELVLSSLRTYRFLFQAFFWKKYRPGCVYLAAVSKDEETGELQYKAFQETFRYLFDPEHTCTKIISVRNVSVRSIG